MPIVVLLPTSKHVLNKTEEEQVYSESGYCFKENARILCSYANPLKSTTLTLLYPRQTTSSCAQVCGHYFDNAVTVILLPN